MLGNKLFIVSEYMPYSLLQLLEGTAQMPNAPSKASESGMLQSVDVHTSVYLSSLRATSPGPHQWVCSILLVVFCQLVPFHTLLRSVVSSRAERHKLTCSERDVTSALRQ